MRTAYKCRAYPDLEQGAMVVISRESDGRWYVTFAADTDTPEPLPAIGHAIGIDLGSRNPHGASRRNPLPLGEAERVNLRRFALLPSAGT